MSREIEKHAALGMHYSYGGVRAVEAWESFRDATRWSGADWQAAIRELRSRALAGRNREVWT